MRSDHGLHRVTAGRRCRWSDHHLGTGDSDQTGPVDDPERSCRSPSLAADQISAGLLVDADRAAMPVSVTRYGLLPRRRTTEPPT
jgi:hypothetical protein